MTFAIPPQTGCRAGSLSALAIIAQLLTTPAEAQTVVPGDAKPTCTVTSTVFATWFESGAPALNGVVKPANSVTFPDSPNCSFYQWSKQMFLWLASPAPISYGGGGGRIFDSPAFFDVTPPDGSGNRTFLPHTVGGIRGLNVRAAQVGPRGFPVVFDKARRMIEIEPTPVAPSGKQLLRNSAGNLIEIERAVITNGRPVFLDTTNRPIQPLLAPRPTRFIRTPANHMITARRFVIGGKGVLLDASGSVIDVEQGQADGGVLAAQNGSLIYYATTVNDVFAYFLTGTKNGGIIPAPTRFPTTAADLLKITTFASAHGKTFPDPEALAVEVKSAWIEAAGLPNLSSYLTMTATVPTYDMTNPNLFTPAGQKTVLLAMTGVHVVGSAKGHPEMIWATFEHVNNAPNGTYTYTNTANVTTTVTQNTVGTWLFSMSGAVAPFNLMHMQQTGSNIAAIAPNAIGPSNTIRWKAWGAASNVSPNPLVTTTGSNTEIISIHNSILGMMPAGDVRNNYIMTGSTWTIGGAAPTGSNEVGTSMLANTMMETYQQGTDNTASGSSNCFSCHASNSTSVSHIFFGLAPLF